MEVPHLGAGEGLGSRNEGVRGMTSVRPVVLIHEPRCDCERHVGREPGQGGRQQVSGCRS